MRPDRNNQENTVMRRIYRLPVMFGVLISVACFGAAAYAESGKSTRVTDEKQHVCEEGGGYPYRKKSEYVLGELDLKPGDVIVDIGAGDGWWTEKMALKIGADCTIGPNVYVERDCQIGTGSYIRDAVVLRGVEVAAGSRIVDQVVS